MQATHKTATAGTEIGRAGQSMANLLRAGLMLFVLMAGLLGIHAPAWAVTTINLTAPAANSSYAQWSNVSLAATAASTVGSIAKVDFYANNGIANTLIGTSYTAPYSLTWNAASEGHYQLTAVASDSLGTQTTSAATAISVAAAPTVNLTSPANNTVAVSPGSVTLSATASTIATIAKIDFYNGATLIGSATAAPYTFTWNNVAPGVYTLLARATDTLGQSTYSAAVNITSATPPVVSLASPAANTNVVAPGSFTLTAAAWGTSGNLQSVAFYNGATLLGTATAAPYSYTWNNVPSGNYSLTAVATDTNNISATSTAVNVTVAATLQAPTATLTAPAANSSYAQWSNVNLAATAASNTGNIAKVDFYAHNGIANTLIGTSYSAPYSLIWNAASEGRYQLTAVATDSQGTQTTSAATTISVVAAPTVNLSSPTNNTVAASPGSFTLSATAGTTGTLAKIDYYNGATLIATATAAPYSYTWNNVPPGTYTLLAKATDTLGQSTLSTAVHVTSATPPVVSLASPSANASVAAPGSFTLTASAWGTSGNLQSVAFYNGATLLGTATAAPYSYTWNNVPSGNYSLTAVATDTNNISATSAAVNVTAVGGNQPPVVSLTSPLANTVITTSDSFTLTATATSTTSTIAKVDFYNGATLIGTATAAPYTYTWANVAAGSYSLTVKATDVLGASTTSAAVTVTVNTRVVQAYYIHTDHLNTPRQITDTAGNIVWQWDNSDPFGNNVPNQNPSGLGTFEYNQRFAGQYFDKETGLHYNHFRDYNPAIGTYIQSDPIGLGGGINTYTYVRGNPLNYIDPYGLRDVDVYIWRAEGLSVGHVMVTEANSTQVILSQFPSNGYPRGPNEKKSFADTMAAEGRAASEIWRINVPNDKAFDASAARERGLKRWSWNPSNDSTQCSIAVSRALKAGGVGLKTITTGTLMPGFFANGLQATPGIGTRLP